MNLVYAQKKKKQTNKQSGKGMFKAKWMWAKRGDLWARES